MRKLACENVAEYDADADCLRAVLAPSALGPMLQESHNGASAILRILPKHPKVMIGLDSDQQIAYFHKLSVDLSTSLRERFLRQMLFRVPIR